MPSRVEKYGKEKVVNRRTEKNQDLYQELKKYKNYQEVSNIESVIERETFNLEDIKEPRKRRTDTKKEVQKSELLSSVLKMDEEKEYDINKILCDAKKMRTEPDELEEKRKLKKEEYNITKQVDTTKLIKDKGKHGVKEVEQDELKELIDTIYSKNLKEEIDKKIEEDLMGDLLPKSEDETIVRNAFNREELEDELKRQQEKKEEQKEPSKKIENSFFTKSMELSTDDLEDDDEDFLADEHKLPIWAVILIIIAVVAVVGFAIYWVYQSVF